jgi:hypothetical protein
MGLDRRILSILYYNDIVDVNDVEKFIGEKDGYYIVIVKGETKKLKVPGFVYPEESVEEIFNEFELEDEFEESENIFERIVEDVKSNNFLISEVYTMEEPAVEEPVLEEPVVEEPVVEEPVVEEPVVKTEKVKKEVKTKSKSTKKVDDDFDDFIKSV